MTLTDAIASGGDVTLTDTESILFYTSKDPEICEENLNVPEGVSPGVLHDHVNDVSGTKLFNPTSTKKRLYQ